MPLIDPTPEHLQVNEDGVTVNQEATPEEAKAPAIPDKFKGKTAEEIAEAYLNLEKEKGRIANDLGEQRKLVDRVLSLEENRQHGQQVEEPTVTIDPTDLLSNPSDTLDRYFETREQKIRAEYEARIKQLEGTMGEQQLHSKHADVTEVTNDPAFLEFVQSNPVRSRIAAAAVQEQDYQALDYLISDWKERQPKAIEQSPSALDRKVDPDSGRQALEAARAASLEGSSSGEAGHSGKIFSRTALIRMKLEDPTAYADPAFQAEMIKAYNEGRVK
jgi:hypothetical protein